MAEFQSECQPTVVKWLNKINWKHWAGHILMVNYESLMSDMVESMNNYLKATRKWLIVRLRKNMGKGFPFYKRQRRKNNGSISYFACYVVIARMKKRSCLTSSKDFVPWRTVVTTLDLTVHDFDLDAQNYNCRRWQVFRIPCFHALNVLSEKNLLRKECSDL